MLASSPTNGVCLWTVFGCSRTVVRVRSQLQMFWCSDRMPRLVRSNVFVNSRMCSVSRCDCFIHDEQVLVLAKCEQVFGIVIIMFWSKARELPECQSKIKKQRKDNQAYYHNPILCWEAFSVASFRCLHPDWAPIFQCYAGLDADTCLQARVCQFQELSEIQDVTASFMMSKCSCLILSHLML